MPLISIPDTYQKENAMTVAKKFKSTPIDELVELLSQSIPNLDAIIKTQKALKNIRKKIIDK